MGKHIDITGQRFGSLVAVSFEGSPSRWLFRCDCGNSCTRMRNNLVAAANPPSCGCAGIPSLRRATVSTEPYNHALRQSTLIGRRFDLTRGQFSELASKHCHYCGCAPSAKKGQAPWRLRNGVDRVDNSIGYTVENCVPCCTNCNFMKRNLTVTDFLAHVSAIHSHNTAQL